MGEGISLRCEADPFLKMDNAVFVILDFIIQCSLKIVVEVFRDNVEFVDDFFFPIVYFLSEFFLQSLNALFCLLVILPHLFHEEMDVLFRCWRMLVGWHAWSVGFFKSGGKKKILHPTFLWGDGISTSLDVTTPSLASLRTPRRRRASRGVARGCSPCSGEDNRDRCRRLQLGSSAS